MYFRTILRDTKNQFHIIRSTNFSLVIAVLSESGPPRGEAGGGGGIAPGSRLWGPLVIFSGEVQKFGMEKVGESSTKGIKTLLSGKNFQEKLGIRAPETNLPRAPEKLSAALVRII